MVMKRVLIVCLPLVLGLMSPNGLAQDSAEQLLEQARAKAAEIEKLKKILNEEPDQNVRLAAFDLMIGKGDSVMHEVAVEAGLASADSLLQAAAFKEAFMGLDRLHLTLVVDPDASEEIRDVSQAYLDKHGDQYVINFKIKDVKAGTVKASNLAGQVIGTQFTYTYGQGNGALFLKDDNAVSGDITIKDGRNNLKFIATGNVR
jgi:hypothetical protein